MRFEGLEALLGNDYLIANTELEENLCIDPPISAFRVDSEGQSDCAGPSPEEYAVAVPHDFRVLFNGCAGSEGPVVAIVVIGAEFSALLVRTELKRRIAGILKEQLCSVLDLERLGVLGFWRDFR